MPSAKSLANPISRRQLPVRILLFKNSEGWTTPEPVSEGRATYNIVLSEKDAAKGDASPAILAALTRLFLESNTARMPPAVRARTHRILLHPLRQGHPHHRRRAAAGRRSRLGAHPPARHRPRRTSASCACCSTICARAPPKTRPIATPSANRSPRSRRSSSSATTSTISAPRPFPVSPWPSAIFPNAKSPMAMPAWRAPTCSPARKSAAEYEALIRDGLHTAEAEEGLGLIALREHRPAEAKTHFADAMRDGSTSARCYIEYAKLETDNAKATTALLKAAGINPKLDEPFALLAERDTDPEKRLAHWKLAAERNPRNPVLLAAPRRSVRRQSQLRWRREGVDLRRAIRHRPRRTRPHAHRAHGHRAGAPGLRRGREAPQGRRGSARHRAAQGRGARRGACARAEIQRRQICRRS